jgi:hypothetical protein
MSLVQDLLWCGLAPSISSYLEVVQSLRDLLDGAFGGNVWWRTLGQCVSLRRIHAQEIEHLLIGRGERRTLGLCADLLHHLRLMEPLDFRDGMVWWKVWWCRDLALTEELLHLHSRFM